VTQVYHRRGEHNYYQPGSVGKQAESDELLGTSEDKKRHRNGPDGRQPRRTRKRPENDTKRSRANDHGHSIASAKPELGGA
jgi:hypothetical protein